MRLLFYNNWHNGDIHFTREFIKDIIEKTNFDEYHYLHNNNPKLLKDIIKLNYYSTDKFCLDNKIFLQINNDIYVNTWIGMGYNLEDIGVPTLKSYYTLFAYIYDKLGIKLNDMEYYIPDINYESYDIDNAKKFILDNKNKKILIDNADIMSYQSGDFDFNYIIDKLSDDYVNIDFILTNKNNMITGKNNIFYTSDIINTTGGDINEISYLSLFCDVIIGKTSGPYNYTVVKQNIHNINKSYICICEKLFNAFWFISIDSKCDKMWINQYDENYIYNEIKTYIGEKI